jgi:hypothetical protein
MSQASAARGLRERLTDTTEDRLGKALTDLFENPLLHGALGRAADAREKAAQAQELAMGALNLPSAADIERLTRRLRSVSQRLEGIEDGVHRLGRTFPGQSIDSRLGAIEDQLKTISKSVGELRGSPTASTAKRPAPARKPAAQRGPGAKQPAAKASGAKTSMAKASVAKQPAAKAPAAKQPVAKARIQPAAKRSAGPR